MCEILHNISNDTLVKILMQWEIYEIETRNLDQWLV